MDSKGIKPDNDQMTSALGKQHFACGGEWLAEGQRLVDDPESCSAVMDWVSIRVKTCRAIVSDLQASEV